MSNHENKLKHLEFIQAVISRMANNSFILKGWTATIVIALFTLEHFDSKGQFLVIANYPILVFWLLDAYFLSQERSYRALYEEVRNLPPDKIDFSMNVDKYYRGRNTWLGSVWSGILLIFYVGIMWLILWVINFIG